MHIHAGISAVDLLVGGEAEYPRSQGSGIKIQPG